MRDGQKTNVARRLRRDANTPEAHAWSALRKLRKYGIAVRRQHPIGHYIVDFAIVSKRIVIEIDGGIHRCAGVAANDLQRQNKIEKMGWRVMRVASELAMSEDHLLALVQSELGL